MEKKREFNLKNFLLLLIIFILSKQANSNITNSNAKEKEISEAPNAIGNQKVKSINTNVNFDKNKGSCDLLNVSERVLFTFQKPTDVVHHLIFSTKFSYYDFKVHEVLNKNSDNKNIQNAKIEDVKTFSNTSLRKKFMSVVLNKGINNNLKENWLLSIKLSSPVKEIELEFVYNISHAMKVDPLSKSNILHYQYINPYNYKIDKFGIKIQIENYSELNKYSIKSPDEGSIDDLENGKGIVINLAKNLSEMSLYTINLPLPFQIEMCDKGFFNMVSILLFALTFILTALGFFTCFKISKD